MVLLIYGIAVKNRTFIFKSAYKEKGAKKSNCHWDKKTFNKNTNTKWNSQLKLYNT